MYKVFVNDKPIFLTSELGSGMDSKYISLKGIDLEMVVNKFARNKIKNLYLFSPDPDKLLRKFKKKIPVVIAGGGLVRNSKNEVLFIKRNGKWDLPKWRVENGESLESAAIRETEEETGAKLLKIIKPLMVTYHIFNRNNKIKLKETFWYEIYTDYTGPLKPEISEGI